LYALPVPALLVGIFGALLAVIIGTFTLKKVSFSLLQTLVFTALCLLGLSLLIGWV
jgi:uncharacterized membrane protein YsdA (DUF1294 family)